MTTTHTQEIQIPGDVLKVLAKHMAPLTKPTSKGSKSRTPDVVLKVLPDGSTEVCATDGYRMQRVIVPASTATMPNMPSIIPAARDLVGYIDIDPIERRNLVDLLKTHKPTKYPLDRHLDFLTLKIGERDNLDDPYLITFTLGGVTVTARVHGSIPRNTCIGKIGFNPAYLADALEAVAGFEPMLPTRFSFGGYRDGDGTSWQRFPVTLAAVGSKIENLVVLMPMLVRQD